ncbi:MAG: hypothetical protein COA57_06315 [Flavobacteriales bacterium]|nr:gliding motility-associated C-terminal domain-containing protein [Bacteroidales bacterium AH-315-I05]PCJ86336.1 MAG: hypothetical protein COA57_06315 [Flavobacteriales bacterium]
MRIYNSHTAKLVSLFIAFFFANLCFSQSNIEKGLSASKIVPNVFTPNGDGINDVLYVNANGNESYQLSVFNRSGQVVFTAEAPEIEWYGRTFAGTEVPQGTYFYVLELTKTGGNTTSEAGHITVIR